MLKLRERVLSRRQITAIAFILAVCLALSGSVALAGIPPQNPPPQAFKAQEAKQPIKPVSSLRADAPALREPENRAAVLYDQYDNPARSNISSQNFEAPFNAYDSQGADDFIVPTGVTWRIEEVDAAGVYLRGGGAAESVNVYIYAASGSLPGTPVYTQTGVVPRSGLDTGSFDIPLDPPALLPAGAYWVSVQANQGDGQWFWRNRRAEDNDLAAWRNPGGAFGRSKCTVNWGTRVFICFISDEAGDQVFRLAGESINPLTPTITGTPPTATSTSTITPTITPTMTSTLTATSTPTFTATLEPTLTGTPPSSTATTTPSTSTSTSTPATTGTPGSATVTGTPLTATPTRTRVIPSPVLTVQATIPRNTPTPPPACGLYWRVVPSPDPGRSYLNGIDIVSRDDMWAVGYSIPEGGGFQQTLILRWNGVKWSQAPSPNLGVNSVLNGVSVRSANDVWAVGSYTTSSSGRQTLILHWDGSAWTVSPTPGAPQDSVLNGVDAISANDVWAVGYYVQSGIETLTMHWDGTAWTQVATPNTESFSFLFGVSAAASNDVWAVGLRSEGGGSRTLTLRWNGQMWSVVPNPPTPDDSRLYAVTAISANDVWAVGSYFYGFFDYGTYTIHWDGAQWSYVPSPKGEIESELNSVSAVPEGDVWSVGTAYYFGEIGLEPRTLALRWDGGSWSEVTSVDPDVGSYFSGVAAVSPNNIWAVGFYGDGNSLIERYSDPCAPPDPTGTPPTRSPTNTRIATSTRTSTRTPTRTNTATITNTPTATYTPTATNTATATPTATSTETATNTPTETPTSTFTNTATPTSTNTPTETLTSTPIPTNTALPTATLIPTNTALPTATSCPVQFTDVPTSNTFYSNIRCLACRGILGGYSDGTFRPNNDITRGQLSKIVANSAGFGETPAGQTFEDVAPANTFYPFIERMARRGIIGGYPCGGAGEPCVAPNRSYFRPNAQATRGQISKIVASAANLSEPISGQTFEDVPPNSTFYEPIGRLAGLGIMGGYPCGGGGEPCGTGNRPYFRPNTNATRGQVSKIVGNTFFPGCNPSARR